MSGESRDEVDRAIIHLGRAEYRKEVDAHYCEVCDGVLFQHFDHSHCLAKMVMEGHR